MKNASLLSLLSIVSLLLAAPVASADIMTYDGPGLVSQVRLHAAGLLGDGKTVLAGQYEVTYGGTPYNAFCVDIDHYAGSTDVTEMPLSSLRNSDQIAYLYETFVPGITNGTEAAAVGVAIWEVLYETDNNDLDASDGYLSITNNAAVCDAANDLLATVPDSYEPLMNLIVLHSPCKQDMLIGSLGEIPEPATLALLILAAPWALLRRRHGTH